MWLTVNCSLNVNIPDRNLPVPIPNRLLTSWSFSLISEVKDFGVTLSSLYSNENSAFETSFCDLTSYVGLNVQEFQT
jgi:hypothetical protein